MIQVSQVMSPLRRNGLKGQQARSPGYRPGWGGVKFLRPARAKAFIRDNAFALAGRLSHIPHTQGDALGYGLIGLSGRASSIGASIAGGRSITKTRERVF